MTAPDLINLRTLASKWYAESANHSTTAIRLRADHMLESARSHGLKAETLLSVADQLTAEILTFEEGLTAFKSAA
jgi:purine-nucleoside phosphorylase